MEDFENRLGDCAVLVAEDFVADRFFFINHATNGLIRISAEFEKDLNSLNNLLNRSLLRVPHTSVSQSRIFHKISRQYLTVFVFPPRDNRFQRPVDDRDQKQNVPNQMGE